MSTISVKRPLFPEADGLFLTIHGLRGGEPRLHPVHVDGRIVGWVDKVEVNYIGATYTSWLAFPLNIVGTPPDCLPAVNAFVEQATRDQRQVSFSTRRAAVDSLTSEAS